MKRIRQSNRRISSDIILATRLLLLLLQICHLQLITARTCAVPPGSEEHSCTDNPLQLTGAVNNRGEQTTRYSIGVDQRIDGTESEQKAIVEVLGRMEDYYVNEVLAHPEYASVRPRCRNLNELCAFWVAVGECETNRIFMLANCSAACRFCLLLNTDT